MPVLPSTPASATTNVRLFFLFQNVTHVESCLHSPLSLAFSLNKMRLRSIHALAPFPSHCRVVVHCRRVLQCVHPFPGWGTFGLFIVWSNSNTAMKTVSSRPSCEHKFSFHLSKYTATGFLSCSVSVCLTLWETAKFFSTVAVPSYIHVCHAQEIHG